MRQLFEALWYGFKKSSPIVTLDSSSSAPFLLRLMPSHQMFSYHWGQLCLREEIGLLSTRSPVMSHRGSVCTREEKGWSPYSLSCPLPGSPGFTGHQRELLGDPPQRLAVGGAVCAQSRQN